MNKTKVKSKGKYNEWKKFIESLYAPLLVLRDQPSNTFLWLLFTIIGGSLGTLINIVQRVFFGRYSFYQSIYIDSVSGSFYIYGLVLIAASLIPIFTTIADTDPLRFRKLKSIFMAISFFLMLFISVFYSAHVSSEITKIELDSELTIDWPQLIFLIASIFFAYFALGIQNLDKYPDKYKFLDGYYDEENDNVAGLVESKPIETPDGIEI